MKLVLRIEIYVSFYSKLARVLFAVVAVFNVNSDVFSISTRINFLDFREFFLIDEEYANIS